MVAAGCSAACGTFSGDNGSDIVGGVTEAGRLLRHARKRAGLTQRALAEKAGVPQPYVARVESGATDPRVSSLSRLLRACETTLEALPGSGEGIDTTSMVRLLRLTPAERLAEATSDAEALAAFDAAVGR